MSEQQQGPGWWLASDGRWYPPEQAASVVPPGGWAAPGTAEQVAAPHAWGAPPPAPVPPKGGMSRGGKVALVVGGIVGVIVLLAVAVNVLGQESTTTFEKTADQIGSSDLTDEGTDATVAEVVVPEGFTVVEGDGVSIAVPSDWTLLDAEDMSLTSDDMAMAFPAAPPAMLQQGLDMFAKGAVLVAFDFSSDSFASNVNVIALPGEAPLSMLESQAEQQFEALGVDVVDSSSVPMTIGEVLRIEYTFDLTLPDGSSHPGGGVQYYVPVGGHTYIVTVSSGASVGSLADAMIDTLRIA
jgi:hypothetical protein